MSMLLNKLLGVKEDVFLIEGSFEGLELNLMSLDYLDKVRSLPKASVESAIEVSEKSGTPAGIIIKNKHPDGDFWFFIRYPGALSARKQTEAMVGDIKKAGVFASVKTKKLDAAKLREALREYFSVSLAGGALCDCTREREPISFAYNEERNERVRALLQKLAKENGYDLKKIDALEICCGNGMSTAAIRPLFKSVLCMDNDRCAVCDGLDHGILEPKDTMVADALELSKYLDVRHGAVLGFMLGTIYEFNKQTWRDIFKESLKLLDDDGFLLFTVNKKEEMDFVADSMKELGFKGKIIKNADAKTIYDGWAFFGINKK